MGPKVKDSDECSAVWFMLFFIITEMKWFENCIHLGSIVLIFTFLLEGESGSAFQWHP